MTKKSNIENVQKLLSGTHNTQNRTTVGYTAPITKKREIGEVWHETNASGTTYQIEQKDGFRVKSGRTSILQQVREALAIPSKCPECDGDMKNHEKRLNEKMYRIHSKCFSCVLILERKIKLEGPEAWETYSKKFMKSNAESWLNDVDREFEILRKAVQGKKQFVNGDGSIETWDQPDREKYLNFIDNEFVEFKKKLIEDLS